MKTNCKTWFIKNFFVVSHLSSISKTQFYTLSYFFIPTNNIISIFRLISTTNSVPAYVKASSSRISTTRQYIVSMTLIGLAIRLAPSTASTLTAGHQAIWLWSNIYKTCERVLQWLLYTLFFMPRNKGVFRAIKLQNMCSMHVLRVKIRKSNVDCIFFAKKFAE